MNMDTTAPTPPDKVALRWQLWRITVDTDIAAKHAPAALRAIQEGGAILPIIDLDTAIAVIKAQQDRNAPWMPDAPLPPCKPRTQLSTTHGNLSLPL